MDYVKEEKAKLILSQSSVSRRQLKKQILHNVSGGTKLDESY